MTGALYKTDNKTLYLHLQAACKGTSVETTVNAKRYRQDGRAAYMALIDHHAGDEKYNAIMKTTMAQLQGLKWNGRACALEKHVSTHRRCYEELLNCADHVRLKLWVGILRYILLEQAVQLFTILYHALSAATPG